MVKSISIWVPVIYTGDWDGVSSSRLWLSPVRLLGAFGERTNQGMGLISLKFKKNAVSINSASLKGHFKLLGFICAYKFKINV